MIRSHSLLRPGIDALRRLRPSAPIAGKLRILVGGLLAAFVAGCGGERTNPTTHQAKETHGANEIELFEKNKGVRLPPELQRELGVATAELAEKSVTRRVEKIAQVYRAGAAVAWLDEAEAREARVGQSVSLRANASNLKAQPSRLATGVLVRLNAASGAASGQVEALIEFEDPAGRVPAGSSLVVAFTAERAHTALAVPESAVIHGAGGAFVYAVNGGHFTRTMVKPGAAADGWVEITDGLYAGDVVVTQAADSLWLIELCALKGGSPCCPVPTKKRDE